MQRGLANKETAWLRVAWLMAWLGYCSCHNTTPPASESSFICDVPHFQTHQPTPPSFLPPVSESSFVMCHISKLTNPLLPPPSPSPLASESFFPMCHVSTLTYPLPPPPPLLPFSPHFQPATFLTSPSHSPPLPPSNSSSFSTCPVSKLTHPPLPLPPLPQISPLFAMCHVSKLTNPFLPLPPLQEVSPCLQCPTFLSSPTRFSHFLPSTKWVSPSAIHMSNHNVPTPLLFITMWLHP